MVFITTIVTGAIWNLLLIVYMLMIYAAQRIFRIPLRPITICVNCGYDLRASRGRCPECGRPIPNMQTSALENARLSARG